LIDVDELERKSIAFSLFSLPATLTGGCWRRPFWNLMSAPIDRRAYPLPMASVAFSSRCPPPLGRKCNQGKKTCQTTHEVHVCVLERPVCRMSKILQRLSEGFDWQSMIELTLSRISILAHWPRHVHLQLDCVCFPFSVLKIGKMNYLKPAVRESISRRRKLCADKPRTAKRCRM
jgi:hypothetical protein